MEDTKKTVLAGNGEKDVPRAVYDGVLTIDVDAQVERHGGTGRSQMASAFECTSYQKDPDGPARGH